MIKKIIAFIVISGALAFAGLLIIGKNYNPNSVKKESPPKLEIANDFVLPKNFNADAKNSTNELVKKISEELAANPPGSLDPNKVVETYITDGVKSFSQQSLRPEIKTSDLKVITNTSPQIIENYLAGFENIMKNNFTGISIPLNDSASPNWDTLQKTYDKTIAELYNLPVPQNFADIHRQEISLLTAQKKIFEYIRNYKNDPMQAWLAVSANQKLDQEFSALRKTLNDYAQKYL